MNDLSRRLATMGSGPTLSAYNPTWRDKIASYMMGDAKASPERARFVGGLLGSTGLGTQGVGVVDATPVGGLLGMQEAAQAKKPDEVAMAAIGLLPGAGMVERGAAKAASTVAKEAPHIIAYHGSPHSFDRFDLSKIGTGEGAQAYGHGLYFADNEDVARGYREALSPYGRGGAPEDVAARVIQGAGGDREAALAELRRRIDAANAQGVPYQQVQELMQARNIANTNPEVAGHMYQVRINADPAHFLDWDKPLSEQGGPVARLIGERPDLVSEAQKWSDGGAGLWHAADNKTGDAVRASQAFANAGVPGIKYLDQGSRGAGEGSRNYVVFNDKLIDILKKYGLLGPVAGAGYAMPAQQNEPQL